MDYLHVQADKPWYNHYVIGKQSGRSVAHIHVTIQHTKVGYKSRHKKCYFCCMWIALARLCIRQDWSTSVWFPVWILLLINLLTLLGLISHVTQMRYVPFLPCTLGYCTAIGGYYLDLVHKFQLYFIQIKHRTILKYKGVREKSVICMNLFPFVLHVI